MLPRILLRRRRAGGTGCAAPIPMEDLWDMFLVSPELQFLRESISIGDKGELPPLSCWSPALSRACHLWKLLVHDESIYQVAELGEDGNAGTLACSQEQEEMWDTICFLIKGTFCAANNLPMDSLLEESNKDRFLLHAAIGALPLCIEDDTDKTNALVVLQRVLELHPDQLSQPGPVLNRLPLHIAANNKRSLLDPLNPPSKVDSTKDFNVELFEMILEQSPDSAPMTPDSSGFYPLHLACASGFSWASGLELLFNAAPEVLSKAGGLPNVVMLVAENSLGATAEKAIAPVKKKIGIRSWMRKKVLIKKHQHCQHDDDTKPDSNNRRNQTEIVDTIFQLLSADPTGIPITGY